MQVQRLLKMAVEVDNVVRRHMGYWPLLKEEVNTNTSRKVLL